jgi:sortase (surface protein transpeptidase)
MEKKKVLKIFSKFYLIGGILLIFFAFAVLSVSFYPNIWYSLRKEASDDDSTSISKVVEDIKPVVEESQVPEEIPLPPFDESLPTKNMIKISSIGVDSEIIQNSDPYKGLLKGTWIVPDFGIPPQNDLPIIIAAHRFGYTSWSSEFRHTRSFYNLPKTKVGDRVQIIWEQRLYEYEIYKAEDNTQITDYNHDLILYTCRMYNSPIRVFRYLKRV